jgi:mRNA interferase HigB
MSERVRIVARSNLTEFAGRHPKARAAVERWHQIAKHATWSTPEEVAATFSKAKVLNAERVRFELHGGDFRMVVSFDFRRQVAFINFLGTHAEYDRTDALTVSMF